MLEITGNDIENLNDSDLRVLIGLLCEAELRGVNLPTAGVTWGGDQNAKDGGIDVRVELKSALHDDGFIPRSITGFQVKKPDMPRGEIIREMRPDGNLRTVINDIAKISGAYIIVSSQGSLSDSALINRRKAMKEALHDCQFIEQIKVDFYDRERIASWVRSHQSLILWVRDKIGRSIQGWKPYENWTNSPGGIEAEYILDNKVRLHDSTNTCLEGMLPLESIKKLRTLLSQSSSSVRLVGLSGVGKTRLLQALFDERIGETPLNRTQVFYTDMSYSPNPQPENMAENLVALQKPAILIIDNCPPELHRRLTSICTASNSQVNLITVEYDVRDDQPEETEVFSLEPASNELIEKMIQVRFNYISQVDAHTIAEFSGGNARIAIALANTIKRGESLTNLRDNELFLRLFQQRNPDDASLLRAAEVCSLVYSFDCNAIEGCSSELDKLGSLIGIKHNELFQCISELKRRDLVQRRSNWGAVLPHAVANRLAKSALENIPLNGIYSIFEIAGNERLLKSFSRRLSYLHECEAAKKIAERWLSEEGLLGDVSNLNKMGVALLTNIASVNPTLTLAAIGRVLSQENPKDFFSRKNANHIEFTQLLRLLAYDKELFEQATLLLCKFAISENPKENNNSIRALLQSLFHLYLSGTHATAEQRLRIIVKLVETGDDEQVDLGMTLLEAALETWHFSSGYGFEFGAHSRDYGFTPSTSQEIKSWYMVYVEYVVKLAVSEESVAYNAKSILASNFRGLWIKAGLYDELEKAIRTIYSKGVWIEGWLAVRSTINIHKDEMGSSQVARLNKLDALLKPKELIDRVRLYALHNNAGLALTDTMGIEDFTKVSNDIAMATRYIGKETATDKEVLNALLPKLLTSDSYGLFYFGQGLADGCGNSYEMWETFLNSLQSIEKTRRRYGLLSGFLNAIDQSVSERLLDEAVSDSVLAAVFPILQTSVKITEKGITRLKQSLDFEAAPICIYKNLGYGRIHETINDEALGELLRLIASKSEGIDVAIDILIMRLPINDQNNTISSSITSLGQDLILMYDFSEQKHGQNMDYHLATIIKKCFVGKKGTDIAHAVCSNIVKAFRAQKLSLLSAYSQVLKAVIAMYPIVFLDTFLAYKDSDNMLYWAVKGENLLAEIKDEVLIEWCEIEPESRYPIVSSTLLPFLKDKESMLLEWTKLALTIIDKCHNPIIVLDNFSSAFSPMSWSGSRAELMTKCLKLISGLKTHKNHNVAEWAINKEPVFMKQIKDECEYERKRQLEWDERFE